MMEYHPPSVQSRGRSGVRVRRIEFTDESHFVLCTLQGEQPSTVGSSITTAVLQRLASCGHSGVRCV